MRLEADDGRPETSPPLRRGVQTADRAVVRERQAIPEDPPSWPDILRTIELGYSNARLEASDNRIKVTIRMAYGFHHANNPIALVMLRRGGLDIRPPQPRTQPTKTAEASFLCYPVKLRDGSSFSPFELCRPTSPFADRDTITPRMAEFQRFRNSYCGTPR